METKVATAHQDSTKSNVVNPSQHVLRDYRQVFLSSHSWSKSQQQQSHSPFSHITFQPLIRPEQFPQHITCNPGNKQLPSVPALPSHRALHISWNYKHKLLPVIFSKISPLMEFHFQHIQVTGRNEGPRAALNCSSCCTRTVFQSSISI